MHRQSFFFPCFSFFFFFFFFFFFSFNISNKIGVIKAYFLGKNKKKSKMSSSSSMLGKNFITRHLIVVSLYLFIYFFFFFFSKKRGVGNACEIVSSFFSEAMCMNCQNIFSGKKYLKKSHQFVFFLFSPESGES